MTRFNSTNTNSSSLLGISAISPEIPHLLRLLVFNTTPERTQFIFEKVSGCFFYEMAHASNSSGEPAASNHQQSSNAPNAWKQAVGRQSKAAPVQRTMTV